jgi:hypothetical protein
MKKYIKALMLIFIIAIAVNAKVYAQTTWQLSQTKGNVEFYYSMSTCNDNNTVVLLKFVNKNKTNVTVKWKEVFETQFGAGVEGVFGVKEMTLVPGTTEQTNCSSTLNPKCIVRGDQVHPAYIAKIQKFNFAEIIVN